MDLQSPKRATRSAKEKAIDNDLLMLFGAVSSSISINVLGSYQELYDLIVNEELTPGNWYKFPYRSVNFLNGWEDADANTSGAFPSYDSREVYVGDEEMILVQAISTYEIANDAYSESYQGDVIQFAPYTNKIGVSLQIANGNSLPDSSIVSGFDLQWDGTNVYFDMPSGYPALFGHFFNLQAAFNDGVDTYYQQGIYEPLTPGISVCQYPTSYMPMTRLKVVNGETKVILLDLTQSDATNYIADSLYVSTVYAIDDAYGWITRRTDTLRNISTPFDFRGRKYRRYEVDRFGFIKNISHSTSGSTATDGIYIITASNITASGFGATFRVVISSGFVTDVQIVNKGRFYSNSDILFIDGSIIGGVPGDDDITITVTAITSSVDFWSIGTNFNNTIQVPSDIYKDFKVFSEDQDSLNIQWNGLGGPNMYNNAGYSDNNVFTGSCLNVTIEDSFFQNTIYDYFSRNIIGCRFSENTIGGEFYSNTIGDSFRNNTISDLYYNIIGNGSSLNIIDDGFHNNTIGNNFYENVIDNNFAYNKIGNYFYSNVIHEGFGFGFNSSQGNVIGNYFYSNKIGEYFYNNFISDGFYNNITVDYFQVNDIKAFNVYSQDFSSAQYVYGSFNCSIFRRDDGVLRLSYVDNTDTIIYSAITD